VRALGLSFGRVKGVFLAGDGEEGQGGEEQEGSV